MKHIILFHSFLICIVANSQEINYNQIILPNNTQDTTIAERLVRIAWNNLPSNEIYRRNVIIAKNQKQISSWSWMDNFSFQMNWNEFTIDPSSDILNRQQYYPRYNIRFQMSFGQFVSIPLQTKINREVQLIEEMNLNEQKLEIRAQVLKLYGEYRNAGEMLKIQNEILVDSQSAFEYFEEKFKNGEISFEKYNTERMIYSRNRMEILNAQRNFESTEINLERMLGVPLEEVF